MKVLVTGISGGLPRQVTHHLLARGHHVMGIDRRPWPDAPPEVEVVLADIRKRPAEDVFRRWRPDAVIHMATVTHFEAGTEERYRINLRGTRATFEHCHDYGVKQAVFVGRHTVYGAAPDAPLYRTEADPPLATATFPDLADLVAADLFAGTALWRWPDLDTCVLRLVYTLGPGRRSTLANYLSGRRVPTVLGFDPLFHLMHESDAAEAVCLALGAGMRGVFNVAGPQPIPLSLMCRLAGKTPTPIPEPLFAKMMGRFGFPRLPKGAVAHIKHPLVVDASPFVEATGFEHVYDEVQTLEAFHYA